MFDVRQLLRYSLAVALAGMLCACAHTTDAPERAPTTPSDMDEFIRGQMTAARIPGLAACVLKNGEVNWAGAYGQADFKGKRPVERNTIFQLGSLSKAVTVAAALQLADARTLDLDADINTYLPFEVINPQFPDTPLTTRALLAHTSSMRDDQEVYAASYTIASGGGDSPVTLEAFLRDYLTPDGQWYKPERVFINASPGSRYAYSNIGYALAGYIVEVVSGIPFDQYCRQNIFTPLGMNDSHWFLRDTELDRLAMPYRYDVGTKEYVAYGHYGYPTYPDGQLRSTIDDFARLLKAIMHNGEYQGVRILSPESAQEIITVQYPDANSDATLGWWYGIIGMREAIGIDGADRGVCTSAFFTREGGIAGIIFMNTDCTGLSDMARIAIANRLLQKAEEQLGLAAPPIAQPAPKTAPVQ